MELSDEQISRIWDAHTVPVFGKTGINPIVFARAIESEVRKQDEALIRQLVDALKVAALQNDCDMVMTGEELRQSRSAIKAAFSLAF